MSRKVVARACPEAHQLASFRSSLTKVARDLLSAVRLPFLAEDGDGSGEDKCVSHRGCSRTLTRSTFHRIHVPTSRSLHFTFYTHPLVSTRALNNYGAVRRRARPTRVLSSPYQRVAPCPPRPPRGSAVYSGLFSTRHGRAARARGRAFGWRPSCWSCGRSQPSLSPNFTPPAAATAPTPPTGSRLPTLVRPRRASAAGEWTTTPTRSPLPSR